MGSMREVQLLQLGTAVGSGVANLSNIGNDIADGKKREAGDPYTKHRRGHLETASLREASKTAGYRERKLDLVPYSPSLSSVTKKWPPMRTAGFWVDRQAQTSGQARRLRITAGQRRIHTIRVARLSHARENQMRRTHRRTQGNTEEHGGTRNDRVGIASPAAVLVLIMADSVLEIEERCCSQTTLSVARPFGCCAALWNSRTLDWPKCGLPAWTGVGDRLFLQHIDSLVTRLPLARAAC